MSESHEMAVALVGLNIQELEARVAQHLAQGEQLKLQLQVARLKAPAEIDRLEKELDRK